VEKVIVVIVNREEAMELRMVCEREISAKKISGILLSIPVLRTRWSIDKVKTANNAEMIP
jgi:hypothetical protein